jgi:hypothetical protein
MIWPDNVVLARVILLVYAAMALTFEWWYLGSWYWLPKTSLKRLSGWALMLASILVLPLKFYREFAYRDAIGVTILFFTGIAFLAILFYRIRQSKAV